MFWNPKSAQVESGIQHLEVENFACVRWNLPDLLLSYDRGISLLVASLQNNLNFWKILVRLIDLSRWLQPESP